MPKQPPPQTISSPNEAAHALVQELYQAEQLDLLHLAVINLLDMVKDGEIDLVLEQDNKSTEQKEAFLQKMVGEVRAAGLQKELQKHLDAHDIAFFQEKEFGPFLQTIQYAANGGVVAKLTVAIKFKDKDIKEMAAKFSAKLGKQVVLSIKVDPSLIGGAIIQHGSYLNDYSLKTQLDLYRSRWHRAVADKQ